MTIGPRRRTPLGGGLGGGRAGVAVGAAAGGAAGASAEGVPLNLPIPGKRSPTVSGLRTGMLTEGVEAGGGGGAAGATVGAGAVGITQSVGLGGAAVCQSVGFGGAAVSQSGVPGVADGAGTRPSATRRGSTSSVICSPSRAASVG